VAADSDEHEDLSSHVFVCRPDETGGNTSPFTVLDLKQYVRSLIGAYDIQ